jgi:hypothetical protein
MDMKSSALLLQSCRLSLKCLFSVSYVTVNLHSFFIESHVFAEGTVYFNFFAKTQHNFAKYV